MACLGQLLADLTDSLLWFTVATADIALPASQLEDTATALSDANTTQYLWGITLHKAWVSRPGEQMSASRFHPHQLYSVLLYSAYQYPAF